MGVMTFTDCPKKENVKVWITDGICDESKKCSSVTCSFNIKENEIKEDEVVYYCGIMKVGILLL